MNQYLPKTSEDHRSVCITPFSRKLVSRITLLQKIPCLHFPFSDTFLTVRKSVLSVPYKDVAKGESLDPQPSSFLHPSPQHRRPRSARGIVLPCAHPGIRSHGSRADLCSHLDFSPSSCAPTVCPARSSASGGALCGAVVGG